MRGDRTLKVKIVEQDFSREYYIYIYYETEEIATNQYQLAHFKDGDLLFSPVSHGEKVEPTLRLNSIIMPKLVEAIQEVGIKLPEKDKIEGLYEASQKHLEDMRALVFKKGVK